MSDLIRKVFPCNEDDVIEVRKIYGKSEKDVRCDLGILKEWLGKQEHLPQDIDDAVLERFLLRNKFSIETTKQKLDMHFTSKGHHKDYLLHVDPTSEALQMVYSKTVWSHLPLLGIEKERISIAKCIGNDDLYDFGTTVLMSLFTFELQLKYDYAIGERIVFDLEGFNWNRYKTFTLSSMSRAMFLVQEAYCTRIVGVEILNPPYFMDVLLQMCKMVLKPKIFSRINVHKDLDSLHKNVPKKCLPKEYGGDLDSLDSYFETTKKMWAEERDQILKALRAVSNEELRIGESKYAQKDLFGVDGTFRKIEVD